MKNPHAIIGTSMHKASFRLAIGVALAFFLLQIAPLLTSARPHPPQAGTITVVNNTTREIRFLYLSPANADDWGPDQLNGAAIGVGQTYTLSGVSGGGTIKVVAEDQDGCFLSQVVDYTNGATWTLTSSDPRNCGS